MAFKSESCDEDVDEDSEENKDSRHVVHCVQLALFPAVVQIIFHCGDNNKKQNRSNMETDEKNEFERTTVSSKTELEAETKFSLLLLYTD